MASKGMGVIYTRTSLGDKLRETPGEDERNMLLNRFYRPFNRAMEKEVQGLLDTFNRCLILDCHSFPSKPLPYELDQNAHRPDICLGTDSYHTPIKLVEIAEKFFQTKALTTDINTPFAGSFVPIAFYHHDVRVSSLMIEVNRRLYMKEKTGEKSASFNEFKGIISDMIYQTILFT
jgi:N-formylglutamate amidohydrolase